MGTIGAYSHEPKNRRGIARAAAQLGGDGDRIGSLPRARLYDALEDLGADRFLLGAVGSWGDTLTDSEVLEQLRRWNRGEPPLDQVIATTGGRRG